jgi:hypothetical protein
MKAHDNRHDLTQTELLLSPAEASLVADHVPLADWRKLQADVVNVAEQRYNLQHENLLGHGVLVALTIVLKRFLVAYS